MTSVLMVELSTASNQPNITIMTTAIKRNNNVVVRETTKEFYSNPKLITMSVAKAKKALGISYLGSVAISHKLALSLEKGVATYGIYLAPADMSGHNVCPKCEHCKQFCLAGSGHNKIDVLSGENRINRARIKRTLLYFYNRPLFVKIMLHEIEAGKRSAERKGVDFSSRINCVSDQSPLNFRDENGVNILKLLPNVQFYDYTKVISRINVAKRYDNYDLTFSFDGYNWEECETALKNGVRVAVVFSKRLPKKFHGYDVIDGDAYDFRYLDPHNVIVGLKYKSVYNDFKTINGVRTFIEPNTPFVVRTDNEFVEM